MFGGIAITYRGVLAVKNLPVEVRNVKRKIMGHVGDKWHERFYDLHFTEEGARKYRYAKRFTKEVTTGAVKRSKTGRPKAPSGRPLHWSGVSYERGKSYRVTATPERSRVTMNVPALNYRNKKNPIHLRGELERVTAAEEAILRKDAQAEGVRLFEQLGATSVRVKIEN